MKTFFCNHISIYVLSAVLVSILFIVSGCCTQRRVVEQNTTVIQQKDSANTKVWVEKVIEYLIDTVYIKIPAQMAERTTQDSISHLENDYATSDARINQDGTLYHDLKTKPQKIASEFQKPVERYDSVRTEYKTKTEYITLIDDKKAVEKELTWWQHTCIKCFPWCLILLIIAIGYIFRKPILKITKRLLCKP